MPSIAAICLVACALLAGCASNLAPPQEDTREELREVADREVADREVADREVADREVGEAAGEGASGGPGEEAGEGEQKSTDGQGGAPRAPAGDGDGEAAAAEGNQSDAPSSKWQVVVAETLRGEVTALCAPTGDGLWSARWEYRPVAFERRNATAALLRLEWEPENPTVEELILQAHPRGEFHPGPSEDHPMVRGTSPLELELSGARMDALGEASLQAWVYLAVECNEAGLYSAHAEEQQWRLTVDFERTAVDSFGP